MDFSICLVFLANAGYHTDGSPDTEALEKEIREAFQPICGAFGCSFSCDPFLSHSNEAAESCGMSQQGYRVRIRRKVKSRHNYHYFASMFHAAAMLVGQNSLVSSVSVCFE